MMRAGLLFLLLCFAIPANAEILVDFEELALAPNSYFDGYGENASSGTWSSRGAVFNTNPFGPGWSYSNINNPTTPGYLNSYAAVTGTGFGGSGNYSLATSYSPFGAFINLPDTSIPLSMQVTNTTYAALSMRDGDSFAKKFGGDSGNDADFFRLTITGFDSLNAVGGITGSTEFMLADFRNADNSLDYILSQWALVDLSNIGNAKSLGFSLDSSDNGAFGMNTPAFFAMDHLRLSAVPEPTSMAVLGILAMGIGVRKLRRRNVN